MLQINTANINDVDLLLDMKLDIIFNCEEVVNLEKSDLEKIVNYAEEEIRENLSEFKIITIDNEVIGTFSVVDYNDGKLIDTIYIKEPHRNLGIGTEILKEIINSNFQALYLWVYRSNERAIKLYKKLGFDTVEETETRLFMKNYNIKKENDIIKAKLFCKEVEALQKKYNLEYFFLTEGEYSTNAKCCEAIITANKGYVNWKNCQ